VGSFMSRITGITDYNLCRIKFDIEFMEFTLTTKNTIISAEV